MMAALKAISGITPKQAISLSENYHEHHPLDSPEGAAAIAGIGAGRVKNFGRFPAHVKSAISACYMALTAAGLNPEPGEKKDIAVIAAGYYPTLAINREFFADYIRAGRSMGRGNLFIYTLPTSSIAEISIFFSFTGPLMFIEPDEAVFGGLLRSAEDMMCSCETGNAVLIWQDSRHTFCAIIGEKGGECTRIDMSMPAADNLKTPEEAIKHFSAF